MLRLQNGFFSGGQPETDQVKCQTQQHDAHAGCQQILVRTPQKRATLIRKIDHRPPSWAIEIAKAQKRERRLHHNAAVHPKQKAREQHIRQVRQDVPHGNMGAAVAEDPAAFDKRLRVQL